MRWFLRPRLSRRNVLIVQACCGFLLSCCPPFSTLHAQSYPSKPVRLVTGGVGGGSDITGRLIAQHLSTRFGQQVLVENRGGASGAIAVQTVARAAPDGHTLLYYSSALWMFPLLKSVPWDAHRDFLPVSLTAVAPNILVVHPSLPVRTVQDLVGLARARPGELNYAAGVLGSTPHLAAELFKSMAKVRILHVSYKGAGPAIQDVIAGQVQLMFASAGSVTPHVASGRLRGLAVSSSKPSPLAPGLPTVSESGLPGFETTSMYALFAPAGTSANIVAQVQSEVSAYLRQADTRERFLAAGVEAVGSSPTELTAIIKAETARLGQVIREAGIRLD